MLRINSQGVALDTFLISASFCRYTIKNGKSPGTQSLRPLQNSLHIRLSDYETSNYMKLNLHAAIEDMSRALQARAFSHRELQSLVLVLFTISFSQINQR